MYVIFLLLAITFGALSLMFLLLTVTERGHTYPAWPGVFWTVICAAVAVACGIAFTQGANRSVDQQRDNAIQEAKECIDRGGRPISFGRSGFDVECIMPG